MSILRSITFLAVVGLVVAGLSNLPSGNDDGSGTAASDGGTRQSAAPPFAGECGPGGDADCVRRPPASREGAGEGGPSVPAAEVCGGAGYLCAGLEEAGRSRVLRFPERSGTLSVRVPLPAGEDEVAARRLRRAAVRGIEAWQGHPFALRILSRDAGERAHVVVEWVRQVGGRALGRTELRYRTGPDGTDYQVAGLTLATRVPRDPSRLAAPASLELTAAHEMGHALGLPHSDDPRDLMYPENTATHPTARDYRTLEALYRIPAGAEIER